MKKVIAMLVVLGVGAAVSLNAADGKALYEKDCAKCHGADGKGATTMGKKMGARDYSTAAVQDTIKDEEIAKAIKEGFKDKAGKQVMKPTPNLTDEEVKALVAHFRTLKK